MHSEASTGAIVVQPLCFKAANGWRGPGSFAIAIAHLAIATDSFDVRHLEPVALMVDLFFVPQRLRDRASLFDEARARDGHPRIYRPPLRPHLAAAGGDARPADRLRTAQAIARNPGRAPFFNATVRRDGLNYWQAIPTNLLLIQSLGLHDRETWNFPSWSLSVEFVTYISFAAFCLVGPYTRRILAVATIAISLAILMFLAPRHMRSTFDYGLFRCLAGFFAGTLCHDAVMRWRIPKWPLPTLVEIATLALVGLWLATSVGTHAVYAAPLIFSLFLYVFVAGRGLLSRGLAMAPMQVFAEWSFAIYMMHAIVLIVVLAVLHEVQRRTGVALFTTISNPAAIWPGNPPTVEVIHFGSPVLLGLLFLLYGAGVLLASYLAYRVVETPGRAIFGTPRQTFRSRATRTIARVPTGGAKERTSGAPRERML